MMMTTDGARWLWALGSVAAYGAMCGAVYWRHKRQAQRKLAQQNSLSGVNTQGAHAWVSYASQTGQAEALAWKTAEVLHAGGQSVRVMALDELDVQALSAEHTLYVIASTYGEGDPPDNGTRTAQAMANAQWLIPAGMPFAVLALGDRTYQHYCGFGRFIETHLTQQGGRALLPRLDVDQMADATIQQWFDQVAALSGTEHAVSWVAEPFNEEGWVLSERRWLNEGSPGEAVYHLVLKPQSGQALQWQSGDLVQVLPPGANQARDYSISSIAEDGQLELLVRVRRLEDGGMGVASGWLCHDAPLGAAVPLRLRSHAAFRMGDNAQRPLILIGNGTGMAGLRAHLKARALQWQNSNKHADRAPCWLLFGERSAKADLHHAAELQAWQAQGVLVRLDVAFSREEGGPRYVQDCVAQCAADLRIWVEQGAAIYVCGSLAGMASGVDVALRQALGSDELEALSQAGRYRRDVY